MIVTSTLGPFTACTLNAAERWCVSYDPQCLGRVGYYSGRLPCLPATSKLSLYWGSEFTQVWS